MSRDRSYETQFLDAAERGAAVAGTGFTGQVSERLEQMDLRHGDRWQGMDLRALFAEIRDEGLDLGGWPVLAAQAVLHDPAIDDDHSLEIRLLLQEVASYGARVVDVVRRLSELAAEVPR